MKNNNTFKKERVITSEMSNVISTETHSGLLNFCANNYLGLANNNDIKNETIKVLHERGFGMSSVRFICGTTDYHKKLEKDLSTFYEQDDTILFASCFDANESVFEAFLNEKDTIISDKLNHASIINGIRLSKAQRFLYNNNNMQDLEDCLKKSEGSRFKMIVTDGVFSMDGEIARLNDICDLADKYQAVVMVDECHGTGVLGKKGRGAVELENVLNRVEIISSTLGKALGGANGGFITGKGEMVDYLRQKGRPYLFSNTLPQPIIAGYIKALDILQNDTKLLNKLKQNIQLFRTEMKDAGFNIMGNDQSAIVPVLFKDEKVTSEFAEKLLDEGIYVIGFSFPVVAKGLARIRTQLSASHSTEDIHKCIAAFKKIGKQMNIIDN